MKKTVFIFIASALFVFASCKKEENQTQPEPQPAEKPFSYHKTGNRSVFNLFYNNVNYDSLIIEVTGEDKGEFEVVISDKMSTQTTKRFIEGDFLKSYIKDRPANTATRLMKHNAKQGDSWADFDGKDSIYTTVKSTNQTITVPAGTFVCSEVEVRYASTNSKLINFINPQAGVVKILVPSTQASIYYELRSKNF